MAQQEEQTETPGSQTEGGGDGGDDRVANLQAEFDRKLGNIREDIQNSNNQLFTRVAEIVKNSQPPQQPAGGGGGAPKGPPDPIDDPEGHAAYIDQRISQGIDQGLKQINTNQAAKEEQVQTMARMVQSYPELKKGDSDLTKKATAIFSGLDDSTRASALGYEVAVTRAAQELGVVPASLRGESGEFSLPAGGGVGRGKKKGDDLPDNYVEISRLMKINIDDPKVRERMKKRAKYTAQDWLRYGSGK